MKAKAATITRFAGVNTADEATAVPANQLRQGENLWNDKGCLQVRPGFRQIGSALARNLPVEGVFQRALPEGFGGYTAASMLCRSNEGVPVLTTVLWNARNEPVVLPDVTCGAAAATVDRVTFVIDRPLHGSGLFAVVAAHTPTGGKIVEYYEINAAFSALVSVDRRELYLPLVLRRGMGDLGYTYYDLNQLEAPPQEHPEEPNWLNGGRYVCFTVDGYSSEFRLPDRTIPSDVPLTVKLQLGLYVSDVSFDIAAGATQSAPVTLENQSVVLHLNRTTGLLTFQAGNQPFAVPHYRAHNGLRITYYLYDPEQAYAVFGGKSAEQYFDGRLIRVGCGAQADKLLYSEKNRPFYFHASASIQIGQADEPLTALALQSKYFFAFKERSIYRLTLTGCDGYDVWEPLEENLDITIPKMGCKMTTVHTSVGCDTPGSIAFCANRLVWYHSDGNVYTLYGSNGYTEGSVYALGINIRDRLPGLARQGTVCALHHNGYYYLGAGEHMYVMDTHVSGFRYLSGYKSPEAGDGGLCWHTWRLPKECRLQTLAVQNGRVIWWMSQNNTVSAGGLDAAEAFDDRPSGNGLPVPFALATALWENRTTARPIVLTLSNQDTVTLALTDGVRSGRSYSLAPCEEARRVVLRPGPVRPPYVGLTLCGEGAMTLHRLEREEPAVGSKR